MFGAILRSAPTAAGAVLLGAVLQFILSRVLPYLGPESGMLYRSFNAIAEHGLLIMLVAVAAGLLARAVVESNAAGVR